MRSHLNARRTSTVARFAVLAAIIIALAIVLGVAIMLLPAPPGPSPIVTPVPR